MDCGVLADSEPRAGGPWHHVNLQHGLLDWTLGELYGIPDYRAGRDQVRGSLSVTADMIERLAARSVEAGRSAAREVLVPSSLSSWMQQRQDVNTHKPSATPLAVQVAVHHPERVRLTPDQAMNIYNAKKTKTSRTAALLAIEYGISAKAIRDIWIRRSWTQMMNSGQT